MYKAQNSRNLPYTVSFWGTPPTKCKRHIRFVPYLISGDLLWRVLGLCVDGHELLLPLLPRGQAVTTTLLTQQVLQALELLGEGMGSNVNQVS